MAMDFQETKKMLLRAILQNASCVYSQGIDNEKVIQHIYSKKHIVKSSAWQLESGVPWEDIWCPVHLTCKIKNKS